MQQSAFLCYLLNSQCVQGNPAYNIRVSKCLWYVGKSSILTQYYISIHFPSNAWNRVRFSIYEQTQHSYCYWQQPIDLNFANYHLTKQLFYISVLKKNLIANSKLKIWINIMFPTAYTLSVQHFLESFNRDLFRVENGTCGFEPTIILLYS